MQSRTIEACSRLQLCLAPQTEIAAYKKLVKQASTSTFVSRIDPTTLYIYRATLLLVFFSSTPFVDLIILHTRLQGGILDDGERVNI